MVFDFQYMHVSSARPICKMSRSRFTLYFSCRHIEATITSARLSLSEADLASIEAVLSLASGPAGPVYGLERDRESSHGEIMKYNLSCINQSNHLEELCTRLVKFPCMYKILPHTAQRGRPQPPLEPFFSPQLNSY